MKIIFRLLLITFSSVSAYVTFLFTSSLASTGVGAFVAFAVLGLAFDFLKCTLPSVILDCIGARKWGFAAISAFVGGLLIAFSLYASFALFDNSSQSKIKNDSLYQMTLEQNRRAVAEYDRLMAKNHKTIANRDYLPIIERTTRELKELQAPQTTGAQIALLMNIALAVLLEFSVVACHVGIRICTEKRLKTGVKNRGTNSTKNEVVVGGIGGKRSLTNSENSTIKKLPVDELAALLIKRGDSKLTYKQLEDKYNLSAPKISELKKYINTNKPHLTAV